MPDADCCAQPARSGTSPTPAYARSVFLLWEVFTEFAEAVRRGDRSWWPFIWSVVALIALAIGFAVWLS